MKEDSEKKKETKNVKKTKTTNTKKVEKKTEEDISISDYDIFPDKELLENFRNTIIQNIIDKEIPEGKKLDEFINDEIDKGIEGVDLSNIQRSHIFNMIEDEIKTIDDAINEATLEMITSKEDFK